MGAQRSVVPIVLGAFETIPKRLVSYMAPLVVNLSGETIQKTAGLGTARILTKVLAVKSAIWLV